MGRDEEQKEVKVESVGWHWFIFCLKDGKIFMAKAQLSPYFIDWQGRFPEAFRLKRKTLFGRDGLGEMRVKKGLDCLDINCEVLIPGCNVAYVSNAGKEIVDAAEEHWGDRKIIKASSMPTNLKKIKGGR